MVRFCDQLSNAEYRNLSLLLSTSRLILLRHGESTWNEANLFTGWHDVPLTEKGRIAATAAGGTMADAGIRVET